MRTETPVPDRRYWKPLRWITGKVLPRGIWKQIVEILDDYRGPAAGHVVESAAYVGTSYWTQATAAFNKYEKFAEATLVLVCFATWSLPWATGAALAAVLFALVWRDAYTWGSTFDTLTLYYWNSAMDAAVAMIFLYYSQKLAETVAPSLVLPAAVLNHGALVCIPLIATMRMALRPKPDPSMKFFSNGTSGEKLFYVAWFLNALWLVSVYGVVLQNTTNIPNYWPDKLRGFLPLGLFAIWFALQRDSLARRDDIHRLMRDPRIAWLLRLIEMLPYGLERGQAHYWGYVTSEVLIYLGLFASLVEQIYRWLTGQIPDSGFIHPAMAVVSFAVCVSSWTFIKNANRAAARALQDEVDARTGRKSVPA